jgi:peptidoglycan hydrolase CwlO-like protein
MPDWFQESAAVVLVVVVLVFLVRSVLGTRGLPAKLDQINDRIIFASDAILEAWRAENRGAKGEIIEALQQQTSAIEDEVSKLRREISSLRSEMTSRS